MPDAGAILIVDDDRALRRTVDASLRKAGWRTLVAGGGAEALSLAAGHDGPIPLAIVDIVMPEIGGLDLANQLSLDRPATKILYMSGFNRSVALDSIRLFAPHAVLQKPFTIRELLARVRTILGL